jgi:tRNA-modifying protein YgfZ
MTRLTPPDGSRGAEAGGSDAPSPWNDVLAGTSPLGTAHVAHALVGVADGAIAHFGDAQGETRAVVEGDAVVAPLTLHGAIALRGPDRVDFVNAQVSHDVRALPTWGAVGAILLDHRGRPQADVTVVRREGDLYVAVDDGRGPRVLEALRTHLVFDQVEIVDLTRTLAAVVVSGHDVAPRLDEALGAPAGTAAAALSAGGRGPVVEVPWAGAAVLLHARHRSRVASLDVHVLARDGGDLLAALTAAGFRSVGEVALAGARVVSGIAATAAEGEEALPQEAGLDARISYRKGCYLGQEIMARIEARGSLRRGPVRLTLAGEPVDPSERGVTDADGRPVGRVGTAAWTPDGGWQALAVLRLDVPVGATLGTLGTQAVHAGAFAPPA